MPLVDDELAEELAELDVALAEPDVVIAELDVEVVEPDALLEAVSPPVFPSPGEGSPSSDPHAKKNGLEQARTQADTPSLRRPEVEPASRAAHFEYGVLTLIQVLLMPNALTTKRDNVRRENLLKMRGA